MPPGRAKNPEDAVSNSFYRYEYQLKDHLGNLRVACRCAEKENSASPSDAYAPVIVQENHYDPWGLGLPLDTPVGSPEDRFTFNGKEKQKDLGWLDYGARMYDAAIGRWNAVDKLTEKMPFSSPYTYALNNPLRFIDINGEFPWSFHIRSFIATSTTGGGLFRGDGRGPSTASPPAAWSRVRSTFTVDPAKKYISDARAISDPTLFYGSPGFTPGSFIPPAIGIGNPTASISKRNFGEGEVSFNFSHSGKDPLTPDFVTPSLDVHSAFSVTEDLERGILSIIGNITGDKFPSTEAFVVDQSGKTKVFLGAKMETGGVHSLLGDNKKPLFNVNVQIMFSNSGNFTGVRQGDQTYSTEDWNRRVQNGF